MNPKLTYHLRKNILPTGVLLVLLALLMALAGHATELPPRTTPTAINSVIVSLAAHH